MIHGASRLSKTLGLLLALVVITTMVGGTGASAGARSASASPAGSFATIRLPEAALTLPADLAVPQNKKSGKFDSTVAKLVERANVSTNDALALAGAESLRLSQERVYLQVVLQPGSLAVVRSAIVAAGGEVTGVGDGDTLIQGWFPVDAIEPVAARADVLRMHRPAEVELLENPQPLAGNFTTEALGPINATAWHNAGLTGAGVKVGVIDGGFQGYLNLLGTDLPNTVTVKNFVDGQTDTHVNTSGGPHGLACAEIVHDVAPGAQIVLAKINTDIDLAEAVAWLKDVQQVDIISTSLGWYNLTPGDGTGKFANLVRQTREAGILWLTAASNDREAHWGGSFADPNSNAIHNFNGAQEVNYFGPGDGNAYLIPAGYSFRVFVRWDDWANHDQDYDLALYRWNGSAWTQVASSQNSQNGGAGQTPTELASVVTSGSATAYGFIIVRDNSTRDVNFEIFAPKVARLDELLHARSLSNLADAPEAVTVAALDVNSPYPQESYSSEGPANGPGGAANGGANKPDISGYANVATASYQPDLPYKFNGTSAATPHIAGAAALLLSAYPDSSPDQLETLLTQRASDIGPAGVDSLFGAGRLTLGAPLPSISLSDGTVVEGNAGTSSLAMTATLSFASELPVTATYATADDTAVAPGDYAAAATTLTFEPGQTSRVINVAVAADTLAEGNEQFVVNMTNPTNATIADGQGVGTIADDDVVQISIGDATVSEGDSGTATLSMNVSLSVPSAQPVSVVVATADGTATAPTDYTAVAVTTLTFAPGETTRSVSVSVVGDRLAEGNETLLVLLSNPVNAAIVDDQGVGTIRDDDYKAFMPMVDGP